MTSAHRNEQRPDSLGDISQVQPLSLPQGDARRTFGLTKRQADLLTFIREYHARHGMTPTYREMFRGIGLSSTSPIHRLVRSLEERGHIRRLPNRARSIALCEERT